MVFTKAFIVPTLDICYLLIDNEIGIWEKSYECGGPTIGFVVHEKT